MEADNDEEFPDPPKEFPDPPTEIEMQVSLPAPPPRDSSKDVMMEYGSNGNNTGNGSNCKRAKKNWDICNSMVNLAKSYIELIL